MRCPAFTQGGPKTSGDVCGETGMSEPAIRNGCPIAAYTDMHCNITKMPPRPFLTKWKDILTRRVRRDQNLLG